jgi:hypothetical protein
MKSGSEELCIVGEYGVYIVQHDDFKDVVECFSPAAVRIESPTLVDQSAFLILNFLRT